MDALLDGYRRFRETYWEEHKELFQSLAVSGQRPRAMVIACCDSRAAPEVIFNCSPGEIFVVRNVANLVPPYAPNADYHGTSAALEFAVNDLNVEHIVVMGHSNCGGVNALVNGTEGRPTDFIATWMSIATAARDRALAAAGGDRQLACRLCERENVHESLKNLMTFPWIAGRVAAGTLRLHGMVFDLEAATIESL